MIVGELILWIIVLIVFIIFSICVILTIKFAISEKEYFFVSVMIFLEISFILLGLDTFLLNGAIGKAILFFLEIEI